MICKQETSQVLVVVIFFYLTEQALAHVSMVLRSDKRWEVVEPLPDIGMVVVILVNIYSDQIFNVFSNEIRTDLEAKIIRLNLTNLKVLEAFLYL